MPRTRLAVAIVIAAGTLPVFAGPTFTTVVLDDFNASFADQRWAAQVGSGGHVAYFAPDGLRLWGPAETRLLHQIGTHIEGLAPDVVTASLNSGVARGGRILGLDSDGGVTALLYTAPEPSRFEGALAVTTPDNDFRVVMARPEVAGPGTLQRRVSIPNLGTRRSANADTLVRSSSPMISHVDVISGDLTVTPLFATGDRTPDNDGEMYFGPSYSLFGDRFGFCAHIDIASNGNTASYFHFTLDGSTDQQTAVVRTVDGVSEVIARSDAVINGVRLWPHLKPLVRINAAGDTLVATRPFPGDLVLSESILLYPGASGEPAVVAEVHRTITPVNHPELTYSVSNSSNSIHRQIVLADDGSVIFDAIYNSPGAQGPGFIHRGPSGEYRVLLARNPELLGLEPDETISDWSLHTGMLSLDASSAAGLFGIRTPQVTPTIFHATPRGVTRVVAVNDEIEVEPGDIRRITGVELLDVAGMRVLFAANFQGGSRGMLLADIPDPGCPADLNNDGIIDADDFFLFLQFFADADPRADINNDGVIDADDFFAYLDLFAQGC